MRAHRLALQCFMPAVASHVGLTVVRTKPSLPQLARFAVTFQFLLQGLAGVVNCQEPETYAHSLESLLAFAEFLGLLLA